MRNYFLLVLVLPISAKAELIGGMIKDIQKVATVVYYHKWFPRIFFKKYDGGRLSGVSGYMLIEWKPVLSIGLLRFSKGSREAYHNHAFNALTWWLRGYVVEERLNNIRTEFGPSLHPKFTPRGNFHKVIGKKVTWALTIRGPWTDTWQEYRPNVGFVTLTHNRQEVL